MTTSPTCVTHSDCPLGTDPAKAVDVYHSLVYPLVEHPAKTQDPRGLSYNDSIIGTILPLYSPSLWRILDQALSELKDGTGDTMLKLADLYMERNEQGHYTNSTDVRVAVNCMDKPAVTDRAKLVEQDRRTREVAPFMSYGEFTGYAPLPTCAFWPVPATGERHEIKVSGLPPIMVVSTTNDPATPVQGRSRSGPATRRHPGHLRGNPAHCCLPRKCVHRRHRGALPCRRDCAAPEHAMLTIDTVGAADLPELMPMLRAYCDFYRVDPTDERLRALASALID